MESKPSRLRAVAEEFRAIDDAGATAGALRQTYQTTGRKRKPNENFGQPS